MKRTALAAPAVMTLLWLAGCDDSSIRIKPKLDSGTDGTTAVEDATVDKTSLGEAGTGSPIDAIPATPWVCAITAKLKPSPRADGGGLGLPATHEFSLLVDWAGNTATTGAGGTASKVSLVNSGGEWTTQGKLALSLSLAPYWTTDGPTSSGMPYMSYEQIAIRPTVDGCTGHGTGHYLGNNGDMLFQIPFEAELAGVVDQTGPAFPVFPKGKTELHPLDLYGVASSELLPGGTSARWVANSGTAVSMSTLSPGNALGVSGFLLKDRALAFASSYRLEVLPLAIDLAGNLTAQPPVVSTIAGPGFFAQDGFEGPLDALLGGQVKVVDATSFPIPAGNKAIRFAPTGFWAGGDSSCSDRFTARLAVAPAAKTVKLSALSYTVSGPGSGPFMAWLRLAVPNGEVSDFGVFWTASKGTPLPNPWSGVLPGADVNSYGEPVQFEFALPAGTGSEVIFDLYRQCTEPMLPSGGLVIDDLRVE